MLLKLVLNIIYIQFLNVFFNLFWNLINFINLNIVFSVLGFFIAYFYTFLFFLIGQTVHFFVFNCSWFFSKVCMVNLGGSSLLRAKFACIFMLPLELSLCSFLCLFLQVREINCSFLLKFCRIFFLFLIFPYIFNPI